MVTACSAPKANIQRLPTQGGCMLPKANTYMHESGEGVCIGLENGIWWLRGVNLQTAQPGTGEGAAVHD